MGKNPAEFTRFDREMIGYMPQQFVYYPDLTIWENLVFSSSIYGLWRHRKDKIEKVLNLVELYEHKDKLAKNISGGMLRRLSLAATLVHDPQLLFLDEPTAGIDPVLRQKFWEHFDALRQEDMTLFITTQYVSEAIYCDIVGIMRDGKLLVVDTPDNLRLRAMGGDVIRLKTNPYLQAHHREKLNGLPFVISIVQNPGEDELTLLVDEASTALPAIMDWCNDNQIIIDSIQEYTPPFDDVFVKLLEEFSTHE
jgi:ABC-2 type transport system ATP-binding protein